MSNCICSEECCRHMYYGPDKVTRFCGIDDENVEGRTQVCRAYDGNLSTVGGSGDAV